MPERSSKRKARRDSPANSLDERESSSIRTENAASLSDKDFTELSEKIEKSVSKRIKDAEVGQREILKMIENLTSKIDTLAERPPNNMRHESDDEDAGNADYRLRTVEPNDLLPNHGQHSNYRIRMFHQFSEHGEIPMLTDFGCARGCRHTVLIKTKPQKIDKSFL